MKQSFGSEAMHRLRSAVSIFQPNALAARPFACPGCGMSLLVRLSNDDIGVRRVRCGASATTLSLLSVLCDIRPQFRRQAVYELSSRGPLFEFLRREVDDLTFSEYFDEVALGDRRDGVLCQDVQRLTFPERSFDLCTSTEVFEHVPDDLRGFAEIRRVLRPQGMFIFTVPISDSVERALLRHGEINHLLPPAYHNDRIRGRGRVLVYRDYGRDITMRLCSQGFSRAHLNARFATAYLGHGRAVVVAVA